MFILGTICCRGGSKGLKNKNIKLLHGKPLIAYTIETAHECKLLNDVIVSTDSKEIESAATQFGIKEIIQRPAELATDISSKWHVFIHAVKVYEQQHHVNVDYLVDMDVTVPLKIRDDIDGAIQLALNNEDTDVIITGYEPERNPYFNMMETTESGFARIVKQPGKPIVRRQDAPTVYSLTPAAYVIKKQALYAHSHWSNAKCKIYPIPRSRAVDIDTELDFKMVEFLMREEKKSLDF
ncbi:MAG TPA: acylneuraminate cytidylyltransferase family protein [Chitinophagaceae bacterium]|jgi:N-acylneuraminate cytidylyltransferase/CMP-N,N'-diacetyllegionaminic acid synthase